MDARDYLSRYKKVYYMIQNKESESAMLKMSAMGTGSKCGEERVQSSGSKQSMEFAVCKYSDLDAEITGLREELNEIVKTIEMLEPDGYDVLHKIYVQFLTLRETAYKCGKSYDTVKRIRKKALEDIQMIIDERERNER